MSSTLENDQIQIECELSLQSKVGRVTKILKPQGYKTTSPILFRFKEIKNEHETHWTAEAKEFPAIQGRGESNEAAVLDMVNKLITKADQYRDVATHPIPTYEKSNAARLMGLIHLLT